MWARLALMLPRLKTVLPIGAAVIAAVALAYLYGRTDGRANCAARYEEASRKAAQAVIAAQEEWANEILEGQKAQAARDTLILQNQAADDEDLQRRIDAILAGLPEEIPVLMEQDCEAGTASISYDGTIRVLDDIARATAPNGNPD